MRPMSHAPAPSLGDGIPPTPEAAAPKIPIYQLLDVAEHEYRSWPAPSYSLLKHIAKSPAHALSYFLHPPEQTPAMLRGYLTHLAMLQPEEFEKNVVRKPEGLDRRTKEGRAIWTALEAEHPGATILEGEDLDRIHGMRDAVLLHPVSGMLLRSERKRVEASLAWQEVIDEVAVVVKARPDLIVKPPGSDTFVVDLKTTRDASPHGFAREVVNYSYLEQAAFYLRGLNAVATVERTWLWIAVESEPPYAVGVYQPFPSDLSSAEARIMGWLETWERCRRTESWPAYSNAIEPLVLPRWAYQS